MLREISGERPVEERLRDEDAGDRRRFRNVAVPEELMQLALHVGGQAPPERMEDSRACSAGSARRSSNSSLSTMSSSFCFIRPSSPAPRWPVPSGRCDNPSLPQPPRKGSFQPCLQSTLPRDTQYSRLRKACRG